MTPHEILFKDTVWALHKEGTYPGPTAINERLGRAKSRFLNGRETRWRREVFKEHNIPYQRPYLLPDHLTGA